MSTNDLNLKNSNKNTMSQLLGTNGGLPKVTPFICIFECNGKSSKFYIIAFYTIAKIKVTSVLEIFGVTKI